MKVNDEVIVTCEDTALHGYSGRIKQVRKMGKVKSYKVTLYNYPYEMVYYEDEIRIVKLKVK
ncbi:hypothetical protein J6TS2_51090 [Heyndrickxia sporothermodurans]|nr:hypothetical protein J6TS2_51090 [Heyndrickxia sporothermodurans]